MINSKIFYSYVPAPQWRTPVLLCDLARRWPRGSVTYAQTRARIGQSNEGEIVWHRWLKSTCHKSLGNFPKNLKDWTWLCPVHHLPGLLKIMWLFETGSLLGTHNWAKRKNSWIKCCGFCYTGDQTKLDPAYGTLYICTDIVCDNKITATSSGVGSFPCPRIKPVGICIILEPTTTSETVNRFYLLSSVVA